MFLPDIETGRAAGSAVESVARSLQSSLSCRPVKSLGDIGWSNQAISMWRSSGEFSRESSQVQVVLQLESLLAKFMLFPMVPPTQAYRPPVRGLLPHCASVPRRT